MNKTIREWYEELPEPYKTEALANCEKQSTLDWNTADATCNKLSEAVAFGFLWQNTPENEDYWQVVYDTLEADEFDEEHDEEQQYEADEFKKNRREDWELEAEQEDNHLPEFED